MIVAVSCLTSLYSGSVAELPSSSTFTVNWYWFFVSKSRLAVAWASAAARAARAAEAPGPTRPNDHPARLRARLKRVANATVCVRLEEAFHCDGIEPKPEV